MSKEETKMTMADLLASNEDAFKGLEKGDSAEGAIVSVTKQGIWVDLGAYGTGLVVGIEAADRKKMAEDLAPGSLISAAVLDPEFEGGYAILSMKRASKEKAWNGLLDYVKNKTVLQVSPIDANKGGLLIELEGVRGFLPVSQLSTDNYPRVNDKDEIQLRLNELIGKTMNVVVLDADERDNKLIFSEKAAHKTEINKVLDKYSIKDRVTGNVTGVVDFGVFVNVDGVEGLVHISEISWERIEDPSKIYKIGDKVDAEIIGIENDRFSLSIKRLTDDPWVIAVKQFNTSDVVEGEVTRITPFGAFVRIHDDIEALVHISELSEDHINSPDEIVESAKKYKFSILNIDRDNHKIALSLKAVAGKKAAAPKAKEVAKKEGVTIAETLEDAAAEKPKKATKKAK